MYNKVILVGNLTRDIELRYAQSGSAIAKTAIATSRRYTASNGEKREEVMFIDLTFFGRSAEIANQYLRKGSKVLVDGRLIFEQWVDQTGAKRSKHSVSVENMQMLDSKSDSMAMGGNMAQPQGGYANGYNRQPQPHAQPQGGYSQPNQGYDQPQNPQPSFEQSAAQPAQKEMPSTDSVPEIDVNEEDLPF